MGKARNEKANFFRIGGRVTVTENLSVSRGVVNGSLGTLISVQQRPAARGPGTAILAVVQLAEEYYSNHAPAFIPGTPRTVPIIGNVERGVPLKAGYVGTVHKSQGKTLSEAVIDPQGAFAFGQIYVAISRAKTSDGITLLSEVKLEHILAGMRGKENKMLKAVLAEEARLEALQVATLARMPEYISKEAFWSAALGINIPVVYLFPTV